MRPRTYIHQFFPTGILLIWIILLCPANILGQEEDLQDSVQIVPKALKTSEIGAYGQKSREVVADVRDLLEKQVELENIRINLIEDDSVIVSQLDKLKDTLENYSLDQLDKLENDANLYSNKINPWIEEISKYRVETEKFNSEIDFHLEVWALSADSVRVETAKLIDTDTMMSSTLGRLKDQMENNINRLNSVKEELNIWETELLATENSLTLAQSELNETYELIADKKAVFINNIWIPEYPPIWKLKPKNLGELYKKSYAEREEEIVGRFHRYSRDNSQFYYNLLFGFLFLTGLIFYMRKRVGMLFSRHPEIVVEENIVLKYPLLSAFIIFIYSVFIFYDIPSQVRYIVFFISVLPFSFLLWQLKKERKVAYVLSFIIFALVFIYLSVFSEAIKQLRFTMLIISAISIYFLLRIRNNKVLIESENPYWLGTLPALIPVFLFGSGLAILANVIGSVQLSLVITRTVIGTFLAYIVIKESVSLIKSFLYLLIVGPLYRISNIVKEDSQLVLSKIEKFLRIASYLYWWYIVLGFLRIRDSLFANILEFVNTPLEVGELSISLGDILIFYIILQISTWISRFIRYFLDKEIYPRTQVDKGVASTFSLMIRYTFAFLGFILALAAAGVNLNQVVVGISALGIGIGFGLQNIVNNFVSGIILALERPITIGDIVKVDDVEGIVKDIGLRASQIRTWEGADVLVPNGSLISGKLMNWTFTDRARRLDVEVRLPLEADVDKALKVMLKTAKSMKELSKDPGPAVNYEGNINGRSVIRVYGWIDDLSDGWGTGTAFRVAVYKALRKQGFDITMPVIDVHIDQKPINNPPLPGS